MLLIIFLFLPFIFNVQAERSNVNCQTPDEQSGLCISAQTCKTMSDFLAKFPRPPPPEIRAKLRPYQCGVSGNKPKICCPENPITFDKPDQKKEPETFQFPDVSNHRNRILMPRGCGHQSFDKVTGGNITNLNEFPWMALLAYQTSGGLGFECGGTIVNKNYILTAAHCVTNLPNYRLIGVRVGEYDIRTKKDCETYSDYTEYCNPPVQDLSVEGVTFHEDYNHKTHANDIALVRVSPINLDQENIKSVCLPFDNSGNFNYVKRAPVVTGWGFTEKGSKSPVLLKAGVPVVPLKECQEKYKGVATINEKQLCAGGFNGVDSCGGDSGSPLQSLELLFLGNSFVQQGIVSFGPQDCGKSPLPGVYTRVAAYMDWILDNMKP